MKKKVIKKKIVAKKPSNASADAPAPPSSDDIEMPMSCTVDVDDVAEDYKVIDMSDIASPVIEFVMPNLGEMEKSDGTPVVEEEEKPKKAEKPVKKAAKKGTKPSTKSENPKSEIKKIQLTAEKLNNELVGLRATILKSKNQLMSKLVRQKKQLETKKGKMEGKVKEEKERKVGRLVEEIIGLKTIDKDTVAKFAALNTKTLNELKINGKTAVAERLMYKLACQDIVIQKVNEIKEKYTEWNKTAAFFMQRLGQQYSTKPEKKEAKAKESVKKEDPKETSEGDDTDSEAQESSDDVVEEKEEEEDVEEKEEESEEGIEEDYNQSDIEMVDSDEEEAGDAAAKNRRNLLLGLIGVKEDKSRPSLNPKKRKIDEEDDVVEDDIQKKKVKTKEEVKREMKQILEKELKTKEVKNPRAAKKTPKVAPTPKANKPVPKKIEEKKQEEDVPDSEDNNPNQKTLVMKVDLSKGGKIAKLQKTPVVPKEIVSKGNDIEDDEDDEDESTSFFLPKSDVVPKRKTVVKAMEKLKVGEKKAAEKKNQKKKPAEAAPPSSIPDKKKGSSKSNAAVSGEMHPSWIASQLKKKELAAAIPCGKKITFSDDDDE